MSLRTYQVKAIEDIRANFRNGTRRVLLHMATGGGKTVCFSQMMIEAALRGKKCVMVVRGRQLVDQASRRLIREGVRHGVQMAGHWLKDYSAAIQICSIDTLIARGQRPEADLIVIDEAHMAVSGGYKQFLKDYPYAYVVAVTATPYTKEPLDHLAESVVHPISVRELIDQGFLVPPRYFAPSAPDMKGVKVVRGEFNEMQAQDRMSVLTGDIIEHWKRLGEGRPTLCFAVNITHSKAIVEQFQMAGVPAEHIEGNHSFKEREAAIERLKRGEIKILSNVGVLCTGVDLPFVGALIMARPTASYNLYIQQAGRGTRPHETKQDFLLLDHAGNVLRHGFITDEREVDLQGRQREQFEGPRPKTCLSCYGIYVGTACPDCGATEARSSDDKKERTIQIDEGVLEELKDLPEAVEIAQFVRRCKEIRKQKGYKRGFVYYKVAEKYGEEIANRVCPKRVLPPWMSA